MQGCTAMVKYRGNWGKKEYRVSSMTELGIVRDLETDKRSFEWTECAGIREKVLKKNEKREVYIVMADSHL